MISHYGDKTFLTSLSLHDIADQMRLWKEDFDREYKVQFPSTELARKHFSEHYTEMYNKKLRKQFPELGDNLHIVILFTKEKQVKVLARI